MFSSCSRMELPHARSLSAALVARIEGGFTVADASGFALA